MNNKLFDIHNKIRNYLNKQKRKEGLEQFFLWLTIFFISVLIISILEAFFNFTKQERTFIVYAFLLVSLFSFIFFVGYKFIKDFIFYLNPDYEKTSKEIGDKFPQIKDELTNILQLKNESSKNTSFELIEAAFDNLYDKIKDIDFSSVIDYSKTKKRFKITLFFLLAFVLLFAIVNPLSSSVYRLVNYNRDFSPPPEFYFSISPTNKTITKGENVLINISVIGKQQKEISFYYRNEDESEFTQKKLELNNNFTTYSFLSLTKSTEFYVQHKNIKSSLFKINVINRPIINLVDVEIIPPSYSKLQAQFQRDNGNITALKGSKVKLNLYASRELLSSKIIFDDSTEKPMQIAGNKAYTEININKNSSYHFEIIDKSNIRNDNPVEYTISVENDLFPSIELISPKEDIKLGTENRIPLSIKVSDDYGFSKLTLNYNLVSSKYRKPYESYQSIPITFNKELKQDDVFFVWDLSPLFLTEGETISFYLEVFDNDNISGPKSTKSKEIKIFIPSLDELFNSIEKTQQSTVNELNETFKEAEKLQNELKKLSDELKQNSREINWQEKEKIEKATEKFEQIGNKLNEISQKLNEMQKEILKNNLLSEETLNKYNELQKLLEQFDNEELKNALKKMQDALKNLVRENVQMSLEELKANEEFIKNSIERTLNLLKRIQVEQKVDELIKRTENLIEELKEISEQTEKSNLNNPDTKKELSEKQKNINSKVDQLKNTIEDLKAKMNSIKDMPNDLLDKIKNEFENQNNDELSEETLKQLNQLQKMNALQNQKQLSSNMQMMKKQFQNLQSQIQQTNQMRSFFEMAKILDDLITLSKEQEELRKQTEQTAPSINDLNRNIKSQNQLSNNLIKILDKMSNLSQKTFAITPEMGKAIGKALNEMRQAQSSLQNQNLPIANNYQRNAMQYINEAATLLKGSMEQLMSGGQGGGMMSLMQQLQQMSQQQMNLNQLTQMLKNGQMTQEMLSQMQKLSQQQELIRKSLEQLNNEAKSTGQSKKLASNLENILQEMKEVVTNLQSNKLDDQTIKQQERILSRLLDAQRSINERDFDETRKSDTGGNIYGTSPKELLLNEERKNKLKEELQKAMREGYKKDYEELIRKYFESLDKIYSK
ncbi:MAG: hypothetical protein N2321_03000 [Melioribacteraceae bacterium]|nr:hypothetical protein [Melioribacteraceae bacterium]